MAGDSSIRAPAGAAQYVEDIGGGVLMPARKVHVGALGVDGGPLTIAATIPLRTSPILTGIIDSTDPNGQLIYSGACTLLSASIMNTFGGNAWAFFYDALVTQANGTVSPTIFGTLPTNAVTNTVNGSVFHGGYQFQTGIWLQFSNVNSSMNIISALSFGFITGHVNYRT